jgi:hypothetical protein
LNILIVKYQGFSSNWLSAGLGSRSLYCFYKIKEILNQVQVK